METRKIHELQNWDKNPRNINEKDYNRLKDQITLLGQYKPLLVTDENIVIGGNMRLKALRELGQTDVWVAPVNFVEKEGLFYAVINGQEQKKPFTSKLQGMTEYALSDNDRAGYYSQDMLANLLGEVDIDLDAYAIDLTEPITLEDMLNGEQNDIKEDEAPEVDETQTVSELGKVYQLGRHRLMCGDATKIEDVEKLMNGQKADMIFTDPPYGYSYESNHQDKHKELMNDDKILNFLPNAYVVTQENAAFYIFCGWQTATEWVKLVKENLLLIKNMIIWKKNNWSMGDLNGAYAGQYEMIIFAHKGRVELQGERDRDVWEFDRVPPTDHPTMKPVSLVAKAITKHLSNIVLDLFGGSGSTLIACEQTNRICYMMELDPKYVDVIRKRYWKFINGDTEEGWEANTPEI